MTYSDRRTCQNNTIASVINNPRFYIYIDLPRTSTAHVQCDIIGEPFSDTFRLSWHSLSPYPLIPYGDYLKVTHTFDDMRWRGIVEQIAHQKSENFPTFTDLRVQMWEMLAVGYFTRPDFELSQVLNILNSVYKYWHRSKWNKKVDCHSMWCVSHEPSVYSATLSNVAYGLNYGLHLSDVNCDIKCQKIILSQFCRRLKWQFLHKCPNFTIEIYRSIYWWSPCKINQKQTWVKVVSKILIHAISMLLCKIHLNKFKLHWPDKLYVHFIYH